MLSKVLSLQFCSFIKSKSSFRIRVTTPLRCEMKSSPTSKALFRLFIRSVPTRSKTDVKKYAPLHILQKTPQQINYSL